MLELQLLELSNHLQNCQCQLLNPLRHPQEHRRLKPQVFLQDHWAEMFEQSTHPHEPRSLFPRGQAAGMLELQLLELSNRLQKCQCQPLNPLRHRQEPKRMRLCHQCPLNPKV